MTSIEFQNIAPTIPNEPGVYKYFDGNDRLLYIGKAKNLRKRVSSYFTKKFANYKTHELVQRVQRIEFMIVNSEQDAFLLENTLIKQFQPRYNINLKDDKTYPFIVIKNEPYPRVFLTRKKINDGSQYLGPFTSVKKVRELLQFIQQIIPLRTCSLNLTLSNIQKKKFKVCLQYHLGNCKGPCEGFQTMEDYNEDLERVKELLKGNLTPVIRHFKEEMKKHIHSLAFEKAGLVKKKIEFLENYQSRSLVVNAKTGDLDVFYLLKEKDIAFVSYLMVRNGSIIQTQTNRVETQLGETPEEILSFSIARFRSDFNSEAKEIIVPVRVEYPQDETIVTIPNRGDKKKLLELAEKNVRYFVEELINKERLQLINKSSSKIGLLEQLQKELRLKSIPNHIECFDNSNFQGSYPVSAMVCFKNGIPSKKDYRLFNVKTVRGINDFATMKEAVLRRYKRVISESEPFPNLVIIDGGKGQLNAAHEAITELDAEGKTTLIGLAKNEEEVFFTGDTQSLKLPLNSPSLKLMRQIRDEVHRFAINFHRKKRNKETFKNELEEIKGIGKVHSSSLLKQFKSVNKIRNIALSENGEVEIGKYIGIAKTKVLIKYFQDS